MKTKVGEYKGKVIVEGGEDPENELKPWEMLFPTKYGNENNADLTIVKSTTGVRVTNVTNTEDSLMAYQLIQIVLPNSPFYGEVKGTQTRVHVIADDIFMGEDSIDYEDVPTMDILVDFQNRNGFPFDPEYYRGCKLRIVASESDLEVNSDTINYDGCIPRVKFIKYTVKLNN